MTGSLISVVAERTGFTPSALRFYEQAGLLRPDRATAGYRSYSDADIEVLTFIKRAKGWMAARRSGHPPAGSAVGPIPVAAPARRLAE